MQNKKNVLSRRPTIAAFSPRMEPGFRLKGATLIYPVLIFVLGMAAYFNSFKGEFLYDDLTHVVNNQYIKSFKYLPQVFTKDIGAGYFVEYNFYRPLQILTYALDHRVWGMNAMGYHLTNTLLHIFAAMVLYWLINELFASRLPAFLTSALFVLHPVHTEAVAYISGRADPLAAIFTLLCLVLYIKQVYLVNAEKVSLRAPKGRSNLFSKIASVASLPRNDTKLRFFNVQYLRNFKMYFFIISSFILALAAKEYSLVVLVFIVLYSYVFKKKLLAAEFWSLFGISCGYIALRMTVLKFVPQETAVVLPLFQRCLGFFAAIAGYLRVLFFPFGLHMEYGYRLFSFKDPDVIVGVITFFSLSVYAVLNFKKDRLIFFSLCWFFLGLLPVANIYPINAFMAEHWLYLPSIGFFLILAQGLLSLFNRDKLKIAGILCFSGIAAGYLYLTVRQNEVWQDAVIFAKSTLKYSPDNFRLYDNLGIRYHLSGDDKRSFVAFKKAVELNPRDWLAYNNLGNLYESLGNKLEAESMYEKSIAVNPKQPAAYYNLGKIYSDTSRLKDAIVLYAKAIERNPYYAKAYCGLAEIYGRMSDTQKQSELLKKALEVAPEYPDAYYSLCRIHEQTGKLNEAIELYKKVIKLDPGNAVAYSNLGGLYCVTKKFGQAIEVIKKAIALDPNLAKAHNNLSIAYFYTGDYGLAVRHCDKAMELGFKVNPEILELLKLYRK